MTDTIGLQFIMGFMVLCVFAVVKILIDDERKDK